MDIATLFAALSLCALLQSALILLRWHKAPYGTDLLWTGGGAFLVGVGAALFGSRYFGTPLALSLVLANALLLLGLAAQAQAPRVADGLRPNWFVLILPPIIWCVACQFDSFRNSSDARLQLYSVLSVWGAAVAVLHLARGGRQLAGRKILFGLWSLILVTMALRIFSTDGVSLGLFDRYAASGLHVMYLVICVAAQMGIGYINLALSDNLSTIAAISRNLQEKLALIVRSHADPTIAANAAGAHRQLWSLRFDRGLTSKATMRPARETDTRDLANAIASVCEHISQTRAAGPDRVVWVNTVVSAETHAELATMAGRIALLTGRASFPIVSMTCGMIPYHGGDILTAAAAADRHAKLIRAA